MDSHSLQIRQTIECILRNIRELGFPQDPE